MFIVDNTQVNCEILRESLPKEARSTSNRAIAQQGRMTTTSTEQSRGKGKPTNIEQSHGEDPRAPNNLVAKGKSDHEHQATVRQGRMVAENGRSP